MTSTARAREYRSRLDDGAAQLYCRTGSRPWLLELAAPLDDDPADPPWTRARRPAAAGLRDRLAPTAFLGDLTPSTTDGPYERLLRDAVAG